jgi:hypothetical protein
MLNAIIIENFQSLRDPVEVRLAPITLLYGPNSAGKSAVMDALSYAHALFTTDLARPCSLTKRHQHQASGLVPGPIKLQFQGHFDLAGTSSPADSVLGRLRQNIDFEVFWEESDSVTSELHGEAYIEWCIECSPDQYWTPVRRLSIDINGHPTLTLECTDPDPCYFELHIEPTAFGTKLRSLASSRGYPDTPPGTFSTPVALQHGPMRLEARNPSAEEVEQFEDEQLLQTLITLANWLLTRTSEILIPPNVVPADRGVIADADLVVFARRLSGSRGAGLPAKFTSLPERDLLSKAVIGGSNAQIIEQLVLERLGSKDQSWPSPPGTPAAESQDIFVNRCLADHLFLDAGYQVHFDVCQVLPAPGSMGSAMPVHEAGIGAVVLCSLTDRNERRLTFQDVGTGISCVLPVLGGLHSGFSFIQQPELHLHPALQAALADVAVEAANRPAQSEQQVETVPTGFGILPRGHVLHILETHSEYLLLRCLKRLRQTAQGLHLENSPQRLTPEQLSVLYFDPRPDGTTHVRRIRVTEDGEFIDRWPRGFFEERGQELFDDK